MNTEITQVDFETRQFIDAVATLKALESKIPECQTVNQVEEIRLFCQTIQNYARKRKENTQLSLWAQEVAVKCQRRIGEVWNKTPKNKGRPKNVPDGEAFLKPTAKDLGFQAKTLSDAATLASVPDAEFQEMIEAQKTNGKIQERKLVDEIRAKAAQIKRQKKTEDQRKYRARAKKIEADPLKATQGDFGQYWKEEQKLLVRFFTATQLEPLKNFWLEAVEKYIALRKENSARGKILVAEFSQQSTSAEAVQTEATVQ